MGRTEASFVPAINLVHDSATERALREQLLELFAQYDLSRWFYAETVNIEDGVLPHSHPVLTLCPKTRGTTYLDNPERLLGCYIHEQLHWFNLLDIPQRASSGAAFRIRYPELPTERPEGCGSEHSNYLHIELNFLEYQALRELLGSDRATEIIKSVSHYMAIYGLVLQDFDEIHAVLEDNGVALPERPP